MGHEPGVNKCRPMLCYCMHVFIIIRLIIIMFFTTLIVTTLHMDNNCRAEQHCIGLTEHEESAVACWPSTK